MKPQLYFARAGDFLVPTDDESHAFVRKLGDGEETPFKPLKVRSLPFHRRYWSMISQISQHISEINISLGPAVAMMSIQSAYDLHTAIKLITGHCITQHIAGTPYVLRIPKPTNFDEMSADEWSDYYPRVITAIHERALPQVKLPEVEQELARLAS